MNEIHFTLFAAIKVLKCRKILKKMMEFVKSRQKNGLKKIEKQTESLNLCYESEGIQTRE